jgi:Glycosyltransferase family 87
MPLLMGIIESLIAKPMSWPVETRKRIVILLLLAMTFCNLTLIYALLPKLPKGYQDFTIFFTGARLLIEGRAASLYDVAAQYQMQQTFTDVPIRKGPLPFNHPPFEALFFVPLAMLPYWRAYLLWTGMNVAMVVGAVALLRWHYVQLARVSWLVLGLGTTGFFPLLFGLMQGQDIALLLLIFVLAMICLDRGNDITAGALLGVGLFRPQLMLPYVALMAIRRWRVLLGFIPVGLLLTCVSLAILGWRAPVIYSHFLFVSERSKDGRAFGLESLPNLRGIFGVLQGVGLSVPLVGALIVTSSIMVFGFAVRRLASERDSLTFASTLAATTTLLVSFHALVYDLILLFPTIFLLLCRWLDGEDLDRWMLGMAALLMLSPLSVFLLRASVLMGVMILVFYVRLVRTRAPAETPAWG